jgi:glucose-1-phosphate adenylyltransferase
VAARQVLAVVLAGGEGRRLWPLTAEHAKPALPVAGRYRLIDFVLSNLVNSGLHRLKILTQYKSDSLNVHIARGWRLPAVLDHYVEVVPAQQRRGKDWFRGSADALYQSLNVVRDESPEHVCIFAGDHIYKMDVAQMIEHHLAYEAEATVAVVAVPIEEARRFGVVTVDREGRVLRFEEKPDHPAELPGRPGFALVSMGNYVFRTEVLAEELLRDAERDSTHDFGRDLLPAMVARGARLHAYDYAENVIPDQPESERGYWRDVGTIDAYFEANMDFASISPRFDLYNRSWPLRTFSRPSPPAKFVFADAGSDRVGAAIDSLVSEGCIISGGRVERSVLSPDVRVNSYAHLEDCILLDGAVVGRHARLRRVIVERGVSIAAGTVIGWDPAADRQRYRVSEGGVTVVSDRR